MDRKADVVIIGAGIVGTATAYFLARHGISVIVCEKGEVAGEQSSRNWGFVRQQGRDPAELPLAMGANRIWQGLERELNADLEWIQGGNLMTFADEVEQAAWEGWVAAAREQGLDSQLLTPDEVADHLPGNRIECCGGVFTPSDGQAEPTVVTGALQRAAEGRGAEFLTHCAVFDIETSAGALSGVVSEHGLIRAPVVVLAAGAWSSRMLRLLGVRLPQMWLRGSVARTQALPEITSAATWTGVAFRQRRDGSLNVANRSVDHDLTLDTLFNLPAFASGYFRHKRAVKLHLNRLFLDLLAGRFSKTALRRELTRFRILDPEPNLGQLQNLMADVRRLLPAAAEAEIERTWAGYIDFTPDMLPTIDRLEQPGGLVLATGFSGHGFGVGPMAGQLTAELARGAEPSLDLTPFHFSRFHDGSRLEPFSVV